MAVKGPGGGGGVSMVVTVKLLAVKGPGGGSMVVIVKTKGSEGSWGGGCQWLL